MNWPQQQPPQQPPAGFPPVNYGMPQALPPAAPQNVAVAAAGNVFAQMLSAPPRQRVNREKPANGTHVVQFSRESKMDHSQQDMQPYLLVAYTVIQSTVPQMVNKTYSIPLKLNTRGSISSLADLAKAVFGLAAMQQIAAQNPTPHQIAQYVLQQMVNPQTGQGMFALLNTWRSNRPPQGKPMPSYEEAFVNHTWLMCNPQIFTLEQAAAAGHQISQGTPPPPPITSAPTVGWGAPPPAPAQQQAFTAPAGFVTAPQPFQAQQQPFPAAQPAPTPFAPPANVTPQAPPPPAVHFPQPQQPQPPQAFPTPPGFPPRPPGV